MLKRIIACFLAVVMMLGTVPFFSLAEGEKASFKGNREIVLKADYSDLENFFMGGRQSLDLGLRRAAPEWLSYTIKSQGRDLFLTLKFDFSSLEEYKAQLQTLLLYAPGIYFEESTGYMSMGVVLMESFEVQELLKFVQSLFPAAVETEELPLSKIFEVETNKITLNEKEYTSKENAFKFLPDGISTTKADALDVKTVLKDGGIYERTIAVTVLGGEEDYRFNIFTKRFKAFGSVKAEENTISVTIESENLSDLVQKTTACLLIGNSISEKEVFATETNVNVVRTEKFDLDNLLEEGAEFTYSATYPEEYKKLSVDDEEITLEENSVSALNKQEIVVEYQRGFRFTRVESITDLSNIFGKIKRTVRYYAPISIAEPYQEQILEEFQGRMVKGTNLNVYDVGGLRCFELNFNAWYTKQVENFGKAVFGSDEYTFKLSRGFFAYAINSVEESAIPNKALSNMAPPEKVEHIFIFANGKQIKQVKSKIDSSMEGNSIILSGKEKVLVKFSGLNFFITLVWGVILITVVSLTTIIAFKVKKKKRERQCETT